ncbi:hypothetical protein ACIP79_00815 [Streptomyces sp. NPDC088747]|uniref:hypothetical protein n=1 Tax=Streptomyces sp. NPDC088747 TaxID=3365886 RepID=UPI003813A4F9
MTAFIEHTTRVDVTFALGDVDDLPHVLGDRVVIPERVALRLRREETPAGMREWAIVGVYGPRRLKSGKPGQEISIHGWDKAVNDWGHVSTRRPDWLTERLAEHLPDGWSPALLELPS